MTWTSASGGYEVALAEGKLVCRNAAGKQLRSVPSVLKDDPVVVGLKQLVEWLKRHDANCQAQVEAWMVRSLPVPLGVLVQVWPDPSWRRALRDLVVQPHGKNASDVGLLRDADADRGIGVVTLDGETVWMKPSNLVIPHPVLLPDLEALRGFIADLNVEQGVPQLFRETWVRPADSDLTATAVGDWAGGQFPQLRHLVARATSQAYVVRGGYAALKIFEKAMPVEARVWIGSGDPEMPTETGELVWVDRASTIMALGDVGPVAWSEGSRMAARLYAGRVVDEEAVA